MSTPTSARCTRCGLIGLIKLRDTLQWKEAGWDVPYQLCANCYGVLMSLQPGSAESVEFAGDILCKGAIESLEPIGHG